LRVREGSTAAFHQKRQRSIGGVKLNHTSG
jgi:hypothetical protein